MTSTCSLAFNRQILYFVPLLITFCNCAPGEDHWRTKLLHCTNPGIKPYAAIEPEGSFVNSGSVFFPFHCVCCGHRAEAIRSFSFCLLFAFSPGKEKNDILMQSGACPLRNHSTSNWKMIPKTNFFFLHSIPSMVPRPSRKNICVEAGDLEDEKKGKKKGGEKENGKYKSPGFFYGGELELCICSSLDKRQERRARETPL